MPQRRAAVRTVISPYDGKTRLCRARKYVGLFFGNCPLRSDKRCTKLSALSGIDAPGGAIQRKPSGRDPCLECMGSSWAG